jgi:hypothetical protein
MVHSDGEAQSLEVLCRADRFNLLDEERCQDRAQDLAVELGPPNEVVVEFVVCMAAEVVASHLPGIVNEAGSGVGRSHCGDLWGQVGLMPEVGGRARLNHTLTGVVTLCTSSLHVGLLRSPW